MPAFLQKKSVLIPMIVALALLAYLIFTALFSLLFQYGAARQLPPSPTAGPTFTATATPTQLAAMANATATPTATPAATNTPVPTEPPPTKTPSPTTTPPPTETPTPVIPQVSAATAVNIRQGPGTNYPAIGLLSPNQSAPVTGRNEAGTWWQISQPDGAPGWVAASVVETNGPIAAPIVQAPPPPPPTATPVPTITPTPEPKFQFEPTGWYADTNYGLTRFLGTITDANGNPVNGFSIEAQCGSFRIISNPSGPVGWPPFYDSAGDPDGFYDVTLDTRPIPCDWFLTVVQSPDGKTVTARLSDAIEIKTTVDESIIVANWRKNW